MPMCDWSSDVCSPICRDGLSKRQEACRARDWGSVRPTEDREAQILDALLEMDPVTFSETGCEINSKAGWWTATRAAGAGKCQFTMPLQLPKGTCNQMLTRVNGVWKTGPGWRIIAGGLRSHDPTKVKSQGEVAQSCPTLSDPMDCSLPGFSIHGIFQAMLFQQGLAHVCS